MVRIALKLVKYFHMMTRTKQKKTQKTRKTKKLTEAANVGSYVFDRTLNRVVKVSSDIPRVAHKSAQEEMPPCANGACDRGSCPMPEGFS